MKRFLNNFNINNFRVYNIRVGYSWKRICNKFFNKNKIKITSALYRKRSLNHKYLKNVCLVYLPIINITYFACFPPHYPGGPQLNY